MASGSGVAHTPHCGCVTTAAASLPQLPLHAQPLGHCQPLGSERGCQHIGCGGQRVPFLLHTRTKLIEALPLHKWREEEAGSLELRSKQKVSQARPAAAAGLGCNRQHSLAAQLQQLP